MAKKHNATQKNVDLRAIVSAAKAADQNAAAAPAAEAKKAQQPQPEPVTVTSAEAVAVILAELIRNIKLVLANKLGGRTLGGWLRTCYLPALQRLGATEPAAAEGFAAYSRLALAIETGTPAQCELVANQILAPKFAPAPIVGKPVGEPEVRRNDVGLGTVFQTLDCGDFGLVTAKLVGANGTYTDAFGFNYVVETEEAKS